MKQLLHLKGILLTLILFLFGACSGDTVETTYCNLRAFFRYDNVLGVAPLNAALNGFGEYCTIYTANGNLYFKNLRQELPVPLTAIAYYKQYISIAGFIVGRSNTPDMITQQLEVYAFDRTCPNCWNDNSVSKPLELRENGQAHCSRCGRTYDLNNGGIQMSGEQGSKSHLYRYRVTYNGSNSLLINNTAR